MIITDVEKIVRRAAELMLSFQRPKVYTKEGHANYVTEGDMKVQAFLMERLAALLPGSCFFAEEKEENVLTDAPTWIIDPIDGTTNYMRGRHHSCISVALAEKQETVMALVYNPYRDQLFTAEKGQGAYCNGEKLHVSQFPFEQALVALGSSPYHPDLAKKTMRAAEDFLLQAGDIRRLASAALDLCSIAEGTSDVYFEYILCPWDYAAGMLIVREAGGICTTIGEEKLLLSRSMPVLACAPQCYNQAKAICEKYLGE